VLKEQIETASPAGVQEINKQISELIPVMNAVVRRIPVEARQSPLTMTGMMTLGFATFEPRALSLTALNLASKSGRVANALAKGGQKLTGSAVNQAGRVARFVQTLGR
jgi:hypothetical protein